jgi:hypothetical protein
MAYDVAGYSRLRDILAPDRHCAGRTQWDGNAGLGGERGCDSHARYEIMTMIVDPCRHYDFPRASPGSMTLSNCEIVTMTSRHTSTGPPSGYQTWPRVLPNAEVPTELS